jgi:hypothetical protein
MGIKLFGKGNKDKEVSQKEIISDLEGKLLQTQRMWLQSEATFRQQIIKLNQRIEKLEAELWRREH